MTDYIRRLVSGDKSRFRDSKLNVELDLVYVTDQVIIMGYPASGVEGLYRNRREDAIRFLESRHGKNYWVFNFCPIKENAYTADVFEGRVSRYPFPDHHAPPLAVMPLVAREMHAWLAGGPERVAVLHCKAGKGRSGTMACTYLLSCEGAAVPPLLERSHTPKTWAQHRMHSAVGSLPAADAQTPPPKTSPRLPAEERAPRSDTDGILDGDSGASPPPPSTPNPKKSFTDALKGVLDLHTAQRMKPPAEDRKGKQGVSIPSQRRFLWYWALLLAHEAPAHLWKAAAPRPKVRLTKLTLRMREQSALRLGIVKAANKLIERTSLAKGPNVGTDGCSSQVWASLARYDDRLVDLLEEWEAYTRNPDGQMGVRRPGSERLARGQSTEDQSTEDQSAEEEVLSEIFDSGKWDKGKMVRSFARLGVSKDAKETIVDSEGDKIDIRTLKPMSDKRWESLKDDLHRTLGDNKHEHQETLQAIAQNADATGIVHSEANSINEIAPALNTENIAHTVPDINIEEGIILDAGREVRVKLYIGQVFIGWFWFIPTFHMPQPPPEATPPASAAAGTPTSAKTTFTLTRKDLDFPLGLGSAIVDVDIEMEWVPPPHESDATVTAPLEPPVHHRSGASDIGAEVEPAPTGAVSAVLQAVAGGGGGENDTGPGSAVLRQAIEAGQGAKE